MPIRTAVVRQTGQGETMTVDVAQWNPVTGEILHTVEEMQRMAQEMLSLSDIRMYEMNMRMLEVYHFEEYFEPAVWQKIVSILDVLAGRAQPETIIQRWKDIAEENVELAKQRQEHYEQQRVLTGDSGVVASCGCIAYTSGAVSLCERHGDDPYQ